jgi:hypothetical protein
MELETFVEHAGRYVHLQKKCTRKALLQALDGHDSLHPDDADALADFLEELSADLSDEGATLRLAEVLRRG